MNFNDVMVLITGVLCFLVGVLMVPVIDTYMKSTTGFNLPAAVTGVVDLFLICIIVYLHTKIVLYNQKRKIKAGSDIIAAISSDPQPDAPMEPGKK